MTRRAAVAADQHAEQETWLDRVHAYRDRTGTDMRDACVALLSLINAYYPHALAASVDRLEELNPGGVTPAPRPAPGSPQEDTDG
jgi:hypothetical protein